MMATSAPRAANASARARPTPRLPPVTNAARPVKSFIVGSIRRLRLEVGAAFLAQRGDALADVGAGEAEELEPERGVERRPRGAQPVVERIFGEAHGGGWQPHQLLAHAERRLNHLVVVDAKTREADALGLLAGESLAQQQIIFRLGHAAQQRP